MTTERLTLSDRVPAAFQLQACPECGDVLLAAVSSVLVGRGHIRHLWACDTCGYSFPTAVRLQGPDGDDLA